MLPPELDITTEELQQEPSSFFSVICCFNVFNPHAISCSILPLVLSIKRVSPSTSCSKQVESRHHVVDCRLWLRTHPSATINYVLSTYPSSTCTNIVCIYYMYIFSTILYTLQRIHNTTSTNEQYKH